MAEEVKKKIIELLYDCLVKLNLLPREGHGDVIIKIQNYKIVYAEILKETV
jgi:hypothetical protein